MKFQKWIEAVGGPKAVSRLLKIHIQTVYAWQSKRASPKAKVMQKLVRLSKGSFSYDDIINETKGGGKKC